MKDVTHRKISEYFYKDNMLHWGWYKMIISTKTSIHYTWGDHCDGWPLVDHELLSVKQERMPAGTRELRHFHKHSRQFFYVLSGKLLMEIEGEKFILEQQQGIEIQPGQTHQAMNEFEETVEFMVISQPSTRGDRIEVSAERGRV